MSLVLWSFALTCDRILSVCYLLALYRVVHQGTFENDYIYRYADYYPVNNAGIMGLQYWFFPEPMLRILL
jgi:hypothetical protein